MTKLINILNSIEQMSKIEKISFYDKFLITKYAILNTFSYFCTLIQGHRPNRIKLNL